MNAPLGLTGGTPETAAAYVNGLGLGGTDVSADTVQPGRGRRR